MKIVIDIDENTWERIRGGQSVPDMLGIDVVNGLNAIKKGTRLPRGHGRLGDLDRVKAMVFNASMDEHFMPIKLLTCDDVTDIIDYTPTIIEGEL